MPTALLTPSSNIITKIPKERPVQRVVVFGAGLSKGFGLPVAVDLLPEALNCARSLGISTTIVEEFLRAFYPTGTADVEDLLGMADAARHYGSIRKSTLRGNRWRPGRVDQMEYQLRRCITAFFWRCQALATAAHLDSLTRFVARLGPETAYVTFNYDLFLETALTLAGLPFSYHLPLPESGVVVLKPHGSINWYDQTPPASVGQTQRIGIGDCTMEVSMDLSASLARRGVPAGYIVSPSPTKRIESEYLRRVWTGFSSVITNSDALAVIGYSMPTADRLARLVLHRANAAFSNTKYITVVNPAPLHSHFRALLDPRLKYYAQRFDEFARTIETHRKTLRLATVSIT